MSTSHLEQQSLLNSVSVTLTDTIDNAKFGLGNIRLIIGPYFIIAVDGAEVIIITVLSLNLQCVWELSTFSVFLLGINSFLGMFVGSFVCAPLSDKYGRKPVLIGNFLGLLVFGLLSATSPGFLTFFFCRLMLGVFVGASMGPASAYLVEVVPTSMRVAVIMGKTISWALGSLTSILLTLWILPIHGWRVLIIACTLVFIPGLLFLCLGEESPRYDFNNDRKESSLKTITKLYKYNRVGTFDLSVLKDDQETDKNKPLNLVQLINRGSNLRDICLFFVYSVAILAVHYAYAFAAPKLLNGDFCPTHANLSANLTSFEPECRKISAVALKELAVTYALSPIGPIITSFLLEWFGRRNTSYFLASVLFLCNALLYTCTSRGLFVGVLTIARVLSKAMNMLFSLLPCEYFTTNIRSFAASIATFGGRVGAIASIFVVVYGNTVSPLLVIGWVHLATLLVIAMTYLLKKETKGLPLDDH